MDIREFVFKKEFAPSQRVGDIERLLWRDVPKEHNGEKVSLDRLKELFPSKDNFSEIDLLSDEGTYKVYGQRDKVRFPRRLAYECRDCHSIIIGMPECNEEDSMGPLTGRKGYSLLCKDCGYEFKFVGMYS